MAWLKVSLPSPEETGATAEVAAFVVADFFGGFFVRLAAIAFFLAFAVAGVRFAAPLVAVFLAAAVPDLDFFFIRHPGNRFTQTAQVCWPVRRLSSKFASAASGGIRRF